VLSSSQKPPRGDFTNTPSLHPTGHLPTPTLTLLLNPPCRPPPPPHPFRLRLPPPLPAGWGPRWSGRCPVPRHRTPDAVLLPVSAPRLTPPCGTGRCGSGGSQPTSRGYSSVSTSSKASCSALSASPQAAALACSSGAGSSSSS